MAGLTIDLFDEESVHGDARGRFAEPIVREEFFNLYQEKLNQHGTDLCLRFKSRC